MSEILKVNYVKNNDIKHIYVFFGAKSIRDKKRLEKLFLSDPHNSELIDIFSSDELRSIQENDIDVTFVDEQLHIDDIIETIKKKMAEYSKKIKKKYDN